ncbi:hypothetical protein PFISCL1PPCAC_1547, partial [Pristionchus fissidentatus]
MQTNQGTPGPSFSFAPITYTPSSDGCDLTVTCAGASPLDISIYYSSTADGASPVYDPSNIGTMASEGGDGTPITLVFDSMRCVDNDWRPYMSDSGYLLENDPNGDPTSWFAYNNIFCTQRFIPTSKFTFFIYFENPPLSHLVLLLSFF